MKSNSLSEVTVRHVGYNFSRPVVSAVLPISSSQAAYEIQYGAPVVHIVYLVVMQFAVLIYRLFDPLYYSRKL